MGRFFVTLVLALAVFGGAAWWFDLFGWAGESKPDPDPDNPVATAPKVELGGPLYAAVNPPAAPPIEDETVQTPGRHKEIVISDCHLKPFDQQEVASPKEGIVMFLGKQIYEEDPIKGRTFPTVQVPVGDKKMTLTYQRWDEGDIVEEGDMLGLVDPVKALNDRIFKRAKIKAAEADHSAATFMAKEAQARLDRLDQLKRNGGGVVPAEDYSAAVLTRDKHVQEELSKKEGVNLSIIEFHQAEAELSLYQIRCMIPGKSRIMKIYKNKGEGVKNLESVMQLYNLSRLRVEGAAEAQYVGTLKPGQKVIIEPTEPMDPLPWLKAHRGEINSVAVAFDRKQPNDPRFVSGSEDQTVCVWRRSQRGPIAELHHTAPVRVVACSPAQADRSLCLAGTSDGRICVWDLDAAAGKNLVKEILGAHHDAVTALAFSPDGKWFASGGQDNTIRLWETATWKEKYPFDAPHGVNNPHQGTITALNFTPQGQLVSAARDNTLRVWELHEKGAKLVGRPVQGRGGSVAFPGISSDGRLMIFDQGRTLQILGVADQETKAGLTNPSAATPFETLALFSPDASLILTAGETDGRMQLWRAPTANSRAYEVRQLVTSERSAVTSAAFAPDGTLAVSGTKDGYVYLWQIPDREMVRNHRIRTDGKGQPLTLTNVEPALDAGRVRIAVNVQNPETPQHTAGRLIPGGRVTLVVEP